MEPVNKTVLDHAAILELATSFTIWYASVLEGQAIKQPDAVANPSLRIDQQADELTTARVRIQALERQVAFLNKALAQDSEEVKKTEQARLRELDAVEKLRITQHQLDRFMSACADQAIQLMELRTREPAITTKDR